LSSDEAIDGEVPGQCMCPFVAEHLDRLRLAHALVEPDHEPLPPRDALSEDRVEEPCRPDHHRHGGRALIPEASEDSAEFGPRRALKETSDSVRAPSGGRRTKRATHRDGLRAARVDVLVSWNFKHIVNLRRIHAFNAVNLKHGYPVLEIRNPREVIGDE
jgi:hypothetical protein